MLRLPALLLLLRHAAAQLAAPESHASLSDYGAPAVSSLSGLDDSAEGRVSAAGVLPLCLSASVFGAALVRVTAAGLLPGGASLEGRAVFAPSDEAFDAALAKVGLSRGRFLASPPERLAETLALHLGAPGQPPLSLKDAERGGAAAASRASSALGAPPPTLRLERRLETRTDVVYSPSRDAFEYVDVQVPAYFVHVDARTLGRGGARVLGAPQRCPWLGGWPLVHVIDAVLLPPAAARYADAGPYDVTQTAVSVPRSGGGSFGVALFAPAAPPGARFPGVVFAHGMLGPVQVYAGTLTHLASHGFLVAAPRGALDIACPSCTFAQLDAYVADIAGTVTWLGSQPRCDASRGVGLFGHSLGGGAALLAAARLGAAGGMKVAGVLALAPANGDICAYPGGRGHDASQPAVPTPNATTAADPRCAPRAAAAALPARTPLLLLAGEADKACGVEANAARVFAAAAAPATLHVLRRGTHCFTEMPGNWFGSECGMLVRSSSSSPSSDGDDDATSSSSSTINLRNANVWGAAALHATRVIAQPLEASLGGELWGALGAAESGSRTQAAQLAAARRAAAAFFSAHAAGRADAAALLREPGTRDSPWLFLDAFARLTALK